jgi:hypothetical protein
MKILTKQKLQKLHNFYNFCFCYYSNVRGGGKLRSNFPTERE